MFAYLISKLLGKTCFSGIKTSFGSRETYLESLLKVLGSKIIFYVFILSFTSGISHVISQHDWFKLGAPAADKILRREC